MTTRADLLGLIVRRKAAPDGSGWGFIVSVSESGTTAVVRYGETEAHCRIVNLEAWTAQGETALARWVWQRWETETPARPAIAVEAESGRRKIRTGEL